MLLSMPDCQDRSETLCQKGWIVLVARARLGEFVDKVKGFFKLLCGCIVICVRKRKYCQAVPELASQLRRIKAKHTSQTALSDTSEASHCHPDWKSLQTCAYYR